MMMIRWMGLTTMLRAHAKKSLGQNWLVNPGVVARIVEAAAIAPTDTIVEIGPGTGILTKALVTTGAHVIAIEKDRELIAPLRDQFSDFPNVEILELDALKFTPDNWKLGTKNWKLVANLPYYLASHLIRLITEQWRPSEAVLMVQEEVANRIMASPPDMNLLALSVQLYSEPSLVMRVSRGSFRPIPKVDSAIIKLETRNLKLETASAQKILALARRAFGQKRKQLKATIPIEHLERAGIPPTARPQELSLAQWRTLALCT